jgi:hypothetical protein
MRFSKDHVYTLEQIAVTHSLTLFEKEVNPSTNEDMEFAQESVLWKNVSVRAGLHNNNLPNKQILILCQSVVECSQVSCAN